MQDKELSKLLFNFLVKTKKYAKSHFSLPSDFPLTDTQFKTLIILKKFKKISLKDLSQEISVSNSSLSIMLNNLVDEGWVERFFDESDRRSTFFSITEKGNNFIEMEVDKKLDEISENLLALSPSEKQVLSDSITNLEQLITKLRYS